MGGGAKTPQCFLAQVRQGWWGVWGSGVVGGGWPRGITGWGLEVVTWWLGPEMINFMFRGGWTHLKLFNYSLNI